MKVEKRLKKLLDTDPVTETPVANAGKSLKAKKPKKKEHYKPDYISTDKWKEGNNPWMSLDEIKNVFGSKDEDSDSNNDSKYDNEYDTQDDPNLVENEDYVDDRPVGKSNWYQLEGEEVYEDDVIPNDSVLDVAYEEDDRKVITGEREDNRNSHGDRNAHGPNAGDEEYDEDEENDIQQQKDDNDKNKKVDIPYHKTDGKYETVEGLIDYEKNGTNWNVSKKNDDTVILLQSYDVTDDKGNVYHINRTVQLRDGTSGNVLRILQTGAYRENGLRQTKILSEFEFINVNQQLTQGNATVPVPLAVIFDSDSAIVNSSEEKKIENLALYLKNHPDVHVTLIGFVDLQDNESIKNKADADIVKLKMGKFNGTVGELMDRRTEAIAKYLHDKYGISSDRIDFERGSLRDKIKSVKYRLHK